MHARISGLADYFAVDELDALRIGRRIVARLNWVKQAAPSPVTEPLFDAEELIGIVPPDLRIPFDPREVIARIVDGSDFDEFKPMYGSIAGDRLADYTAIRWAFWPTREASCSARSRRRRPSSSSWPTAPTRHCCSCTNTTGYMVGKDYEEAG